MREFKLSVSSWSANSRLKEIKRFQLIVMLKDIHELIIALWIRFLSWNAYEVEMFLTLIRNELKLIKIYCYWSLYIIFSFLHFDLTADTLDSLTTLYTNRSRESSQFDNLKKKVNVDIVVCLITLLKSMLSIKSKNILKLRKQLLKWNYYQCRSYSLLKQKLSWSNVWDLR